jgi:hypothetical protein
MHNGENKASRDETVAVAKPNAQFPAWLKAQWEEVREWS